jgi:hypothetical protein
MNHGRSCYPTWMRGAIWRAATSLPSQPEAAVGRQKYRSRVLLRMPRFASNLARPARKVKHTLACAVPLSVRSRPRVRFRSTQTSALGRLQPFRASPPKPHPLHPSEKRLVRTLLQLARHGQQDKPQRVLPKVSQETLAEKVGTTRSRVNFFMNKFRKLGFIMYNCGLRVDNSLLSVVRHD